MAPICLNFYILTSFIHELCNTIRLVLRSIVITDCPRLVRGHNRGMVLSIGDFLFAKDKNRTRRTGDVQIAETALRMTTMHINNIGDDIIIKCHLCHRIHNHQCRRSSVVALQLLQSALQSTAIRWRSCAGLSIPLCAHQRKNRSYDSVRQILNQPTNQPTNQRKYLSMPTATFA